MMLTEAPVEHADPGARRARWLRALPLRRPGRPDGQQVAALLVTLLGLAPVIAAVIQRAGRPFLPVQDAAVIDLRVRDVLTFSANTPLVGVYSRFDWNHPGPLMYYLVAPFAWVFGNPAWATVVGLALLQGLAVAWTARLAWKTGGLRWTVAWVAILALTYVPMDPTVLQSPWNPYVALPFFVLFLLQCWAVAQGEPRRLPGFLFVATFLVQTHIGYALLVAVLGAWALVRMVIVMRADRRRIRLIEVVAPLAAVVVLWVPVLILDPALDPTSNLSRLLHFYATSRHRLPPMGWHRALQYLATEFHWLPPWADGSQQVSSFGVVLPAAAGWLALPVTLVVLAWWSAWRRKRRDLRLVAEMAALLLPASVASLALIEGAVTPYLFYWRTAAGAATVVLTATVLVEAWVAGRWRRVTPVWSALLAGGVTAWSVLFTAQVARADGPVSPFQPQAASVLSQMHAAGLPAGPFLVRAWGATEGGVAAALIDQFAREGRPVRVDRAIGYEFGYGRTATGRDVKWVYLVIENSAIYSLATRDSGHPRVVAVTHPLPASQQDELIRLQRRVLAVLTADGYGTGQYVLDLDEPLVGVDLGRLPGMSPSDLAELGRLNAEVAAHGCLCSVLQVPAKDLVVSDRGTYFASVRLGPGRRSGSEGADAAGGPGAALPAR